MLRQLFRRYRIAEPTDTEGFLWLTLLMRLG